MKLFLAFAKSCQDPFAVIRRRLRFGRRFRCGLRLFDLDRRPVSRNDDGIGFGFVFLVAPHPFNGGGIFHIADNIHVFGGHLVAEIHGLGRGCLERNDHVHHHVFIAALQRIVDDHFTDVLAALIGDRNGVIDELALGISFGIILGSADDFLLDRQLRRTGRFPVHLVCKPPGHFAVRVRSLGSRLQGRRVEGGDNVLVGVRRIKVAAVHVKLRIEACAFFRHQNEFRTERQIGDRHRVIGIHIHHQLVDLYGNISCIFDYAIIRCGSQISAAVSRQRQFSRR